MPHAVVPPQTSTLVFDSGSFDGMLKKIKEFNGQLAADASVSGRTVSGAESLQRERKGVMVASLAPLCPGLL